MGDTVIACDIVKPNGPIDSLISRLSGWKGIIDADFDQTTAEDLLRHLIAMKARYR